MNQSGNSKSANILGIALCLIALIAIGLFKSSKKKEIRDNVINDVLASQERKQGGADVNTQSNSVADSFPDIGTDTTKAIGTSFTTTIDSTSKPLEQSTLINSSNKEDGTSIEHDSPSKQETEKWILNKLNSYTRIITRNSFSKDASVSLYAETDFKFVFDKYYLIVTFVIKQVNEKFTESERNFEYKIPIYDIKDISGYRNYNLCFITNKETIIANRDNGLRIVKSVEENECFPFDSDTETDLVDRLKKAFFHLKKFYEAPKNNEVF